MTPRVRKRLAWCIAGLLLAIIIAETAAWLYHNATFRLTCNGYHCINGLRQVDSAKEQAAMALRVGDGYVPQWDDLKPFLYGRCHPCDKQYPNYDPTSPMTGYRPLLPVWEWLGLCHPLTEDDIFAAVTNSYTIEALDRLPRCRFFPDEHRLEENPPQQKVGPLPSEAAASEGGST
jgi:hypothetical protein